MRAASRRPRRPCEPTSRTGGTRSKLHALATTLAFLALTAVVGAPVVLGAETCANEQLRAEDNSKALPDCRAYELVSTDSNHAMLAAFPTVSGVATADGDAIMYVANDAPEHASGAEPLANRVVARRDPTKGWGGVSQSPPVVGPVTGYFGAITLGTSTSLSASFVITTQPLTGGPATGAEDAFIGRPDGTYRLLTPIGPHSYSELGGGNADFSHIYFYPAVAQLPSEDPQPAGNLYSWTEQAGLRLVGVLPDGNAAPGGARLAGGIIGGVSEDANRAAFVAENRLYVRIGETQTKEVSASRRNIDPDPNPGPGLTGQAGITADGSRVLFLARSELTNDATTGSSGGVATDAGADLYAFDVDTGELIDLTVDTDPGDAATGANVQAVLGASPDGSYIYFTATGHLAAGATPGHKSLYVSHDGEISFVANADGLSFADTDALPRLYVTPDGRHAVLQSTDSLTGYDNTDPVTGQRHSEVFLATYGAGIQCVSCRSDGTRPTADTFLAEGLYGRLRVASDDGSRVFFDTTDAVVPQAAGGLRQVYEWEDGRITPLSPLGSPTRAYLTAASASGDDVFFTSFDALLPGPTSGDQAIFDARVGGGFPATTRQECSGEACRGSLGPEPSLGAPASGLLSGAGNAAAGFTPAPLAQRPPLTRAQKLTRALKACKARHNRRKRVACEKTARKNYGRTKR
jgi:hypothetical protein